MTMFSFGWTFLKYYILWFNVHRQYYWAPNSMTYFCKISLLQGSWLRQGGWWHVDRDRSIFNLLPATPNTSLGAYGIFFRSRWISKALLSTSGIPSSAGLTQYVISLKIALWESIKRNLEQLKVCNPIPLSPEVWKYGTSHWKWSLKYAALSWCWKEGSYAQTHLCSKLPPHWFTAETKLIIHHSRAFILYKPSECKLCNGISGFSNGFHQLS